MDEFIIVKKALPRNGKRLCLRIRSDTLYAHIGAGPKVFHPLMSKLMLA